MMKVLEERRSVAVNSLIKEGHTYVYKIIRAYRRCGIALL